MAAPRRGMEGNWFSGSPADRAAHRRGDPLWLRRELASPRARLVWVWRARNLVRFDGGGARAVYTASPGIAAGAGSGMARPGGPIAPLLPEATVYLGTFAGQSYFAAAADDPDWVYRAAASALPADSAAPAEFADVRDMGGLLPREEAGLLAHARAMLFWHHRHRYCGVCGAVTRSEEGGHARACTNHGCRAKHFPRTDPAVIVLVIAPASGVEPERCLLGRPASWPARLYSTVAGFVEPGEELEQAVRREVHEETGVRVGGVEYHSSQPWPFPSSLMLGFHAYARSTAISLVDDELEDARWFSRDEIVSACHDQTLRLPRDISIAYRLVADWYGEGDSSLLEAALRT